jgi:hypothetical protein
MVTDPATTPSGTREQILFGSAVAFTYGLLMVTHIVFGLFFALSIVCAGRGVAMAVGARLKDRAAAREAVPEPAVAAVAQ